MCPKKTLGMTCNLSQSSRTSTDYYNHSSFFNENFLAYEKWGCATMENDDINKTVWIILVLSASTTM